MSNIKGNQQSTTKTLTASLLSISATIVAILSCIQLAKGGFSSLLRFVHIRSNEVPPSFSQRITESFSSSDISFKTILLGLGLIYTILAVIPRIRKSLQPDPLGNIPELKRESFLFGNFGKEKESDYDGQSIIQASKELQSNIFLFPMPMGARQLLIGDSIALNHVLHDISKFPSTSFRHEFIRFVVGAGLIVADSKAHPRQRRALAPAFTQSHIRTLAPVFTQKAEELGEKLLDLARKGGQKEWQSDPKEGSIVNISEMLDCASFDIIGKAGFGVEFDCIQHGLKGVKLADGYQKMLQACVKFDVPRILLIIFSSLTRPSWLSLPINHANRTIRDQNAEIEQWTEMLIEEKVKRTQAMLADGGETAKGDVSGEPLDLMEKIVRSNEALRNKNDAITVTEKELRDTIRLILFAGYETSSVATSLTLNYLAHDQRILGKVQTQLLSMLARKKEQNGGVDINLTADELQSEELTLLTNCIKETLRLSPAVVKSDREAAEDCVIPLGRPIPSRNGKEMLHQIHVPKGTVIGACFKLPNCDEQIWGPNPEQWNPERWSNLPNTYKDGNFPGPAGVATFSNGPASCLGSRFAMLEIIALLVGVLSRIHLEPSKYEVKTSPVLVSRPIIKGLDIVGLPLRITPLPHLS